MKKMKASEKITQKMTRDGAVTENLVTGEVERISRREAEADVSSQKESVNLGEAAAEQATHTYEHHRAKKAANKEHPHTYAHLDIMDRWLKDHGMPPITRVFKYTRNGKRLTLEDECLQSHTLPSIAYGYKRCSLKHKIGPQEKFCNHHPGCRSVWSRGRKVVKFIGYDAGEIHRSEKVFLRDLADPKYSKWYPLMEWGWHREDCIRAIEVAGLPQPGKSSCFFCPSMKQQEIIYLREQHPDLFRRACALEDNAQANLKTIQGLGRNYSWKTRYGKEFFELGNC